MASVVSSTPPARRRLIRNVRPTSTPLAMLRRLFTLLTGAAATVSSTSTGGEIPPQFPRVSGEYQMTKEWAVTLPGEFAKRFEKGEFGTDLVLWRKGITCWTTVYNMKKGDTPASTLAWIKKDTPKKTVRTFEHADTKPPRYAYLLHETTEEGQPERWALYSFAFGERGHVMMSIYFDQESDVELAKKIWMSITEKP